VGWGVRSCTSMSGNRVASVVEGLCAFFFARGGVLWLYMICNPSYSYILQ